MSKINKILNFTEETSSIKVTNTLTESFDEASYADASDKLLHAKTRVQNQKEHVGTIQKTISSTDNPKRKEVLALNLKAAQDKLKEYETIQKQREEEFAKFKSSRVQVHGPEASP
jgi:protein-arginine kinase activator protein McsA